MYRFLNEINEEIAREEKLLQTASKRSFNKEDDKGALLLRGPKGKKSLVKQTRYVDEEGQRRSKEIIIGEVASQAVASYIGREYNTKLVKFLNENIKNLKHLAGRFKPFDVDAIVRSLPTLTQDIIRQSQENDILFKSLDPTKPLAKSAAAPTDNRAAPTDNRAAPTDNRAADPTDNRAAPTNNRAAPTDRSAKNTGVENSDVSFTSGRGENKDAFASRQPFAGHNHRANANQSQTRPLNYLTAIMASDGLFVRSKSEAIISNLLNQYSIEYEYESRLELKDQSGFKITKAPDFTIKTKRGTIIWEHLGLLDNEDYFEANANKLRLYWRNGFILNENLIVTVDEPGGGINARTIDSIIKTIILPYA